MGWAAACALVPLAGCGSDPAAVDATERTTALPSPPVEVTPDTGPSVARPHAIAPVRCCTLAGHETIETGRKVRGLALAPGMLAWQVHGTAWPSSRESFVRALAPSAKPRAIELRSPDERLVGIHALGDGYVVVGQSLRRLRLQAVDAHGRRRGALREAGDLFGGEQLQWQSTSREGWLLAYGGEPTEISGELDVDLLLHVRWTDDGIDVETRRLGPFVDPTFLDDRTLPPSLALGHDAHRWVVVGHGQRLRTVDEMIAEGKDDWPALAGPSMWIWTGDAPAPVRIEGLPERLTVLAVDTANGTVAAYRDADAVVSWVRVDAAGSVLEGPVRVERRTDLPPGLAAREHVVVQRTGGRVELWRRDLLGEAIGDPVVLGTSLAALVHTATVETDDGARAAWIERGATTIALAHVRCDLRERCD